jgi:hypothetical protein
MATEAPQKTEADPIVKLRRRVRRLRTRVDDLEERIEMLELSEHDHDGEQE